MYRMLEEVLADKEVELVIVNTPNYSHFEYAKKALEAGKHVVVEKPLVTTAAEGEELKAIAEASNVVLSVFQNRRYDSDLMTVKKVIEEGTLGKIVEAEIHYDRSNQALSPKIHKENAGPGTGALYDLGSHLIDQALYLFGMPQAVFADVRTMRPGSLIDDYFEVLLYYPDLRVRLHTSYFVHAPLPSYIIHGTSGSFTKSRADVQEADLQAGRKPGGAEWGIEPAGEEGTLFTQKDGKASTIKVDTLAGNYMQYFDGIYKAIRNNEPAPVTALDGINVIRIIEAAYQSSREQKVINIPSNG